MCVSERMYVSGCVCRSSVQPHKTHTARMTKNVYITHKKTSHTNPPCSVTAPDAHRRAPDKPQSKFKSTTANAGVLPGVPRGTPRQQTAWAQRPTTCATSQQIVLPGVPRRTPRQQTAWAQRPTTCATSQQIWRKGARPVMTTAEHTT